VKYSKNHIHCRAYGNAVVLADIRPQPTRRTSWKLVANPGWQLGFPTSFQLLPTSSQLLGVANKLTTW